MKKMNRKGFTLVELLAVIVILAILMAIAATNIGPVIDNSRRSSMRTTAQMLIEGVQTQLQTSYELYPGTYVWNKSIVDRGGIDAPFGGKYVYYDSDGTGVTKPTVGNKIGSGVYRVTPTSGTDPVDLECGANKVSWVKVTRGSDGNYSYEICLSTDYADTYLQGSREKVDDSKETSIFYGEAKAGISD